jgi:hypothetical protein
MKHWDNKEKPEMSLKKLQFIATACIAPNFKAKWLQFWNSGSHSHQAVHFLPKGFSDKRKLSLG